MEKDLQREMHIVYSVKEVMQAVEAARSSTQSINHKIHLFTKSTAGLGAIRWSEDVELHEPGGLWNRIVAFFMGISPIEAGLKRLHLTEEQVRQYKAALQNGGYILIKEYSTVADEMAAPFAAVAGDAGANEQVQHDEQVGAKAYDQFVDANKFDEPLYDDRTGEALDKAMLMDAEYADDTLVAADTFHEPMKELYISDELYDEAYSMNRQYDAMRYLANANGKSISVEPMEADSSKMGYPSHDLRDVLKERVLEQSHSVAQASNEEQTAESLQPLQDDSRGAVHPFTKQQEEPPLWNENGDPLSVHTPPSPRTPPKKDVSYLADVTSARGTKFITDETTMMFQQLDQSPQQLEQEKRASFPLHKVEQVTVDGQALLHAEMDRMKNEGGAMYAQHKQTAVERSYEAELSETAHTSNESMTAYVVDDEQQLQLDMMRMANEGGIVQEQPVYEQLVLHLLPSDEEVVDVQPLAAVAADFGEATDDALQLEQHEQLFLFGEEGVAFMEYDDDETAISSVSRENAFVSEKHVEATPFNVSAIELKNGHPTIQLAANESFDEQVVSMQDQALFEEEILEGVHFYEEEGDYAETSPEEYELLSEMYRKLFGEDVTYQELQQYEQLQRKQLDADAFVAPEQFEQLDDDR